ncbi:hypothetical protein [Pelosinus baikalensis]|uniref:Citrate transporter n=1 Tax=Pelosinus baikalensis TaxID=2892015 RepID=A0ABS8HNP4_9FIRM|nr:hypothetical protein [Pelosinus baikalensis]MCC5464749.1 hypothetical protein [Pelosinus baikalensis]
MLTAIGMLGLFLVITGLMVTRKLPALLALPILAVGVAVIAGVPLVDTGGEKDMGILNYVIQGGATRLVATYCAVILGAWLGQFMNQTAVSKRIVKGAAELGGDNPLLVTVLITLAVALLFTTIEGLGAAIMTATIVVPIMTSVGVPGITAACMMLFGMATGGIVNMSNWAFYTMATGVAQSDVQTFTLTLAALTAIISLLFAIIEFKRTGIKFAWAAHTATKFSLQMQEEKPPVLSLVTPIIPIFCVILFNWPILPAFLAGLVWCFLTVYLLSAQRKFSQLTSLLMKAAFEGVSDSAPAVLLMIGIGMVLNSFMHPIVAKNITPFLQAVIPSQQITYIVFFSLLAPLALYRGPLNLWGLGSGIAAVIIGLKILPAPAVFSAFLSAERVQYIGDPTNTHNVWLSNYVGVDVNQILVKVLPYIWGLAIIGIIISSSMWF